MFNLKGVAEYARLEFEASARRVQARLGISTSNERLSSKARLFLVAAVCILVFCACRSSSQDLLWLLLFQMGFTSKENQLGQNAYIPQLVALAALVVRGFFHSVPSVLAVALYTVQMMLDSTEPWLFGCIVFFVSDRSSLRYNVLNYINFTIALQICSLRTLCIKVLNEFVSRTEASVSHLIVDLGEEGVVNACAAPIILAILFAGDILNTTIMRLCMLTILVLSIVSQTVRVLRGDSSSTAKEWPEVFRENVQESSRQFENILFTLLLTMYSKRLWNNQYKVLSVLCMFTTVLCIRVRADMMLSIILLISSMYVLFNPLGENQLLLRLAEEMLLNHETIRVKLALRDELRLRRRDIFLHSLINSFVGLLQGLSVNLVCISMIIAGSIFFSHKRRDLVGRRLIAKEMDSRNFIDHAIKQKLAGCATSIALALRENVVEECLKPETIDVLTTALAECRLGTVLCLETTLKRQLSEGTYVPRPVSRKLRDVMNAWRRDWRDVRFFLVSTQDFKALSKLDDDVDSIRIKESAELYDRYVAEDWHLCQNFLEGLITRVRAITKTPNIFLTVWTHKKKTHFRFGIRIAQPLSRLKSLYPLFELSHGKMVQKKNWWTFILPAKPEMKGGDTDAYPQSINTRTAAPLPPSSRQYHLQREDSMIGKVPPLPDGLVYAVLDDSAIIRLNTRITSQRFFKASPRSVFTGEHEKDALTFVRLCMEVKPDICILDENLDYSGAGGRLISGSVIAQDLRAAGYDGVIAIHSANELMASEIDLRIVDGFVRKGESQAMVRNELARLYYRRLLRKQDNR